MNNSSTGSVLGGAVTLAGGGVGISGGESTTLNLPSTSIMKKVPTQQEQQQKISTSSFNTKKSATPTTAALSQSSPASSQHGGSTQSSSALKYKPILKHTHSTTTTNRNVISQPPVTTTTPGAENAASTNVVIGAAPTDSTSLVSSFDLRYRGQTGVHVSGTTQSGVHNRHPSADTTSSTNLSIMNESDSVSGIMRMRQDGKDSRPFSLKYDQINDATDFFYSSNSNLSCPPVSTTAGSTSSAHFSPRSSMKIKVIDETETDN